MNLRPKREFFEEIAQIMGIKQSFVEKDWYVVQIIKIITGIWHDDFDVIFTGGTTLSKAHKLLRRFSEDVDFRVLERKGNSTPISRSAFKSKVVDALRLGGFAIENDQIEARNKNRFFRMDIYYESYFPPAEALRPHILIEFTVKNIQLIPRYLPVSSFVNEIAKHSPEVARIGCIDPVESAADKLSAISWRIPDRVPGGQNDDPSLVRHIHDLAILKDAALRHNDFSKLVATSMQHDGARPKDVSISGSTASEKFQRMLTALHGDNNYAQEYKRFVGGMSYAAAEQTPGFTEAVDALENLVKVLSLDTNLKGAVMTQWQTIIPIRGIDLRQDQRFDFADGMTLDTLPNWVPNHPWLEMLDDSIKQLVKKATHGFIINYEAEALGSPDPAWQGPDLKSIQEVKYELAVLASFALWLSCPSPVRPICVLHAAHVDEDPTVRQIKPCPRVFHHPKDSNRAPSTKDIKQAQRLHSSLAQLQRGEGSEWNAFQAIWAALQTHVDIIRYFLFWVALESLFGPDDGINISQKLSQRIAAFLAKDHNEAQELSAKVKKGYKFRSTIAHGRWKANPDSETLLAHVETIARDSLMYVLLDNNLLKTFSGTGKDREKYLDGLAPGGGPGATSQGGK